MINRYLSCVKFTTIPLFFNLAFVLLNAIKQFMVQSPYVTHIVVKSNPHVLILIAYYKWKGFFCSPVLQIDNDYKPIMLKYWISANNIADLFQIKTFDTWNMAAIRFTLKVVSLELQVMVYCCCSYKPKPIGVLQSNTIHLHK